MSTTARELKPLGYGGLLDETFELYRQNFVLFVGIIALIQIPLAFFQAAVMPTFPGLSMFETGPGASSEMTPEAMSAFFGSLGRFFLYLLVAILVGIFIPGIMTKAISDRYLGHPATIAGSYGYILRRFFSYLWTWIVIGLFVLVSYVILFILVLIIGFFATLAESRTLDVIGTIALVVVMIAYFAFLIWFFIRSSVVGQVFVVENTWGFRAIQRSWELTKGHAGRTFVLFALVYLLIFTITLGVSLVAMVGIGIAMAGSEAAKYLVALIQGIAGSLTSPVPWILLTLLYFDIRIRKEAFDLQVLAQSLGAPTDWGAPVPPVTAAGFCVNCGTALTVGAQFCPHCGTAVAASPAPAAAPEPPPGLVSPYSSTTPSPPPPSGSGGAEGEAPRYRRVGDQ